jgi:hypothetical protein
VKTNKRLGAAADFRNHPAGYLVMEVTDWDGGPFELHPQAEITEAGLPILYLPSTDAPGYRVAISTSNPDTLERFGRALTALARKAKGAGDSDDE